MFGGFFWFLCVVCYFPVDLYDMMTRGGDNPTNDLLVRESGHCVHLCYFMGTVVFVTHG